MEIYSLSNFNFHGNFCIHVSTFDCTMSLPRNMLVVQVIDKDKVFLEAMGAVGEKLNRNK